MPKIRKPRIRIFDQEFRYLKTMDEVNQFLAAARAHAGQPIFMLYATAVYTAMRAGELAGLMWSDVDLEHRRITVHRSYKTTTKANDVGYVPVQDALLPLLRDWRLANRSPYVFVNERGGMLGQSARAFDQIFYRVLGAAGFPAPAGRKGYINFHCLRHTYASLCVISRGWENPS